MYDQLPTCKSYTRTGVPGWKKLKFVVVSWKKLLKPAVLDNVPSLPLLR
jgi:hypothetical protein